MKKIILVEDDAAIRDVFSLALDKKRATRQIICLEDIARNGIGAYMLNR